VLFHVDDMWTSTGGRKSASCGQGEGDQKPDFLVDVVNE